MMKRIDGGQDYFVFSDSASEEEKEKVLTDFKLSHANEYYEDGEESIGK